MHMCEKNKQKKTAFLSVLNGPFTASGVRFGTRTLHLLFFWLCFFFFGSALGSKQPRAENGSKWLGKLEETRRKFGGNSRRAATRTEGRNTIVSNVRCFALLYWRLGSISIFYILYVGILYSRKR